MDLKLIRNLVRLMERSEVTELEIDDEKAGMRIHLKRGAGTEGGHGASVLMMPGTAPQPAPQRPPVALGLDEDDAAGGGLPAGTVEITSPMVGTFYRSQTPESDPYVNVGSTVEDEDVVCIIEAMKVMNEIKAEAGGEIVEILVENGEPVEFGQPLFLLKTR